METVFWDIDTQKDFFPPEARIPVERADPIRPALGTIVEYALENDSPILSSVSEYPPDHARFSDDPDFDTTFPAHCVEGTTGAEKIEETRLEDPSRVERDPLPGEQLDRLADEQHLHLIKADVDSFENPNVQPLVERIDPFQFAVFGVGLDRGIKAVVEHLVELKQTVTVIEDATCALNESDRSSLLLDLRNYGVQVIGLEEATSGYIL